MKKTPITSPFILQHIKNTSWQNREYINNLLQLERYIKYGANGMASNQMYFVLREKYQMEFLALLSEIDPVKMEKQKKEFEKLAAKNVKEAAAELLKLQRTEKKAYAEWIALGGKP